MGKIYQTDKIDTSELTVPETVSVTLAELAGEVGEVREGLLALAVGTGLQVMTALMEADVTAKCGPQGKHDEDRVASRHGHGPGSVTLGERRVAVQRPRIKAVRERDKYRIVDGNHRFFAAQQMGYSGVPVEIL